MQKKVLDYHYTTDPLHWGTLPCLPQQFSAKKETHGRETQGKKHTKFRVSNFKNAVSDNFRINMIRKLFLHYLRIKLIYNKEKV